ncbi:MAG TPA: hypothetical protein VFN92_02425 [Solirubrobacterales bacterium]|nr:hypothetical protein [Solirubrobacterales bacterium]
MQLANSSYYFQQLEKEGYLRVSRKKRVRGLTRHYYVAIRQAVIVDAEFAKLAPHQQHGVTEATLRDLLQRYGKAWRADTLRDRGVDLFHNELLDLDEQGWKELMQLLEAALQRSLSLEAEAQVRARREGARRSAATVALAGFESPPNNHPQDGPAVFFDFFRRSYAALVSGTLDARDDSHLTWVPLRLDEQGWKEFAGDLFELRRRAAEIKLEAAERLRHSGGAPIHTTFAFAGFQSPAGKEAAVPSSPL